MPNPMFPPPNELPPRRELLVSKRQELHGLMENQNQLRQAQHDLTLERAVHESTNSALSQAREVALEMRSACNEQKEYHRTQVLDGFNKLAEKIEGEIRPVQRVIQEHQKEALSEFVSVRGKIHTDLNKVHSQMEKHMERSSKASAEKVISSIGEATQSVHQELREQLEFSNTYFTRISRSIDGVEKTHQANLESLSKNTSEELGQMKRHTDAKLGRLEQTTNANAQAVLSGVEQTRSHVDAKLGRLEQASTTNTEAVLSGVSGALEPINQKLQEHTDFAVASQRAIMGKISTVKTTQRSAFNDARRQVSKEFEKTAYNFQNTWETTDRGFKETQRLTQTGFEESRKQIKNVFDSVQNQAKSNLEESKRQMKKGFEDAKNLATQRFNELGEYVTGSAYIVDQINDKLYAHFQQHQNLQDMNTRLHERMLETVASSTAAHANLEATSKQRDALEEALHIAESNLNGEIEKSEIIDQIKTAMQKLADETEAVKRTARTINGLMENQKEIVKMTISNNMKAFGDRVHGTLTSMETNIAQVLGKNSDNIYEKMGSLSRKLDPLASKQDLQSVHKGMELVREEIISELRQQDVQSVHKDMELFHKGMGSLASKQDLQSVQKGVESIYNDMESLASKQDLRSVQTNMGSLASKQDVQSVQKGVESIYNDMESLASKENLQSVHKYVKYIVQKVGPVLENTKLLNDDMQSLVTKQELQLFRKEILGELRQLKDDNVILQSALANMTTLSQKLSDTNATQAQAIEDGVKAFKAGAFHLQSIHNENLDLQDSLTKQTLSQDRLRRDHENLTSSLEQIKGARARDTTDLDAIAAERDQLHTQASNLLREKAELLKEKAELLKNNNPNKRQRTDFYVPNDEEHEFEQISNNQGVNAIERVPTPQPEATPGPGAELEPNLDDRYGDLVLLKAWNGSRFITFAELSQAVRDALLETVGAMPDWYDRAQARKLSCIARSQLHACIVTAGNRRVACDRCVGGKNFCVRKLDWDSTEIAVFPLLNMDCHPNTSVDQTAFWRNEGVKRMSKPYYNMRLYPLEEESEKCAT